jgi:hypothetical protein
VRLRHETAHHRANIARNKIGAAQALAESEARAAQVECRNAFEAGDFDTATAAQARMVEVEARRVRLQEQAEALERSPVLHHADPVEAFIAARTEPTAKWLREHRDWLSDPRKSQKLTAADADAQAEGHVPDTPAYFDYVERFLGLKDCEGRSGSNGSAGASKPTPAFNPTDVSTHIRNGGKEVVLTRGEKAAATDGTLVWSTGPNRGKPIGVAEFARRKVQMAREGRYNKLD